jgi:hypothetical protein
MKCTAAVISVAVVSILAGTSTVALAQAVPGGNAQAIAFYRSSAIAMSKEANIEMVESGYLSMDSSVGKKSTFSWSWGGGLVQPGWVAAEMNLTLGQTGGRLAWVSGYLSSDVPRPRCATAVCPGSGNGYPFQVVMDKAGVYGRFLPPVSDCFTELHGNAPWILGSPWVGVSGTFAAMTRQGGVEQVTSTYGWNSHQNATEVDTISVSTRLWVSSVVKVTAGVGPKQPAFTISQSGFRYAAVQSPEIVSCSS